MVVGDQVAAGAAWLGVALCEDVELAGRVEVEPTEVIAPPYTKIDRYRATLDAGGDPALIAGWIRETATIRTATLARIGVADGPPQRLNEDHIAAIVEGLGGLLAILKRADPRDKAEIYSRIGLRVRYEPGLETIKAEVVSDDFGRVLSACPRGDLNPHALYGH